MATVQESIDGGRVVEETGPRASRNRLQTTTLLDAIAEHGFDAAFGGARRDEERARAKERILSVPRRLRRLGPQGASAPSCGTSTTGASAAASTCASSRSPTGPSSTSGSTSLAEDLEVPSIYFAHEREVFRRDGMLLRGLARTSQLIDGEQPVRRDRALPHRRRHDAAPAPCARRRRRSRTSSPRSPRRTITERGETRADDRVSARPRWRTARWPATSESDLAAAPRHGRLGRRRQVDAHRPAAARRQGDPRRPARRPARRATGELDLARLTDGLRAEREQGITIDVAYRYFATAAAQLHPGRHAPATSQYTRNMVTGASTADLARRARRRAPRRRRADAPPRLHRLAARHPAPRGRGQQDGPRRLLRGALRRDRARRSARSAASSPCATSPSCR